MNRFSALLIIVTLILLGTLLLFTLGQSGLFLRTALITGSLPESVPAEVVDDTLEDLNQNSGRELTPEQEQQKETDCQTQKTSHILHCGMGLPEDDYECRTTHAEHAYQECLTTWNVEDVPTQESSVPPTL